ncbi:hypothetical protein V6N12_010060 [Hibiscus sabdariffa]|uniref:Reverse transcriptase zinc-binding domain-containing protein n=1 Tax=Hibiscus sabdariffa TaxID=183260 RepID=A0ABR2ECK4_9ROSI
MMAGTTEWDARKVNQVFEREDARRILDCPIANTHEDRIIWGQVSSGSYTTRSGHNWLTNRSAVREVVSPLWKTLSKLKVLSKIRIFGWRLANEALPVGSRVRAAYLGDGICRMCQQGIETYLHAVRECPSVQEVLKESGIDVLLPQDCDGRRATGD